jgi:hypothetical protein
MCDVVNQCNETYLHIFYRLCHLLYIYAYTLHLCLEGATSRITRWYVLLVSFKIKYAMLASLIFSCYAVPCRFFYEYMDQFVSNGTPLQNYHSTLFDQHTAAFACGEVPPMPAMRDGTAR